MSRRSRDIEDRAFNFAREVVAFCERHHRPGGVLTRLLYQLLDAATSTGSNLEEAAEGQSRADFVAKMCIVRKEARESRFWLRLIAASYPVHQAEITPLLHEATEIRAIVSAIIRNTRSNSSEG
jgi:four helix bundle protein